MKLTLTDYVGCWAGHKDWLPECQRQAVILLQHVNPLLADYELKGGILAINPKTKSLVSGETGGGFRPHDYPVGAEHSSHKLGMAVDIYDHDGKLDAWLSKYPEMLVFFDLYREHPSKTDGWCHLSTKAPLSKNRTFYP